MTQLIPHDHSNVHLIVADITAVILCCIDKKLLQTFIFMEKLP